MNRGAGPNQHAGAVAAGRERCAELAVELRGGKVLLRRAGFKQAVV